jgi:phosphatidylserine/phosphatidylglycerophosphate/cardiolipin synthase-like enzyme
MIVVSPTDRWLKSALDDCTSSLSISSPFVGDYLSATVARLKSKISIRLLTRTLLTDFARNASDFDAVYSLAQRIGGVLSLSSLHAKVYIVDRKRALITSANATFSGMYRNRECGFEITDRANIRELDQLIDCGFGSTPRPQLWTVEDLEELRVPVERLRSSLPRVSILPEPATEAPIPIQLARRQYDRLVESFSGWLQLTMEGLSRIRSETFTMDQVVAACAPLAASRYPNNRHVREKLRQQMQRLRDLGLVLFVGRGRYERLASPS